MVATAADFEALARRRRQLLLGDPAHPLRAVRATPGELAAVQAWMRQAHDEAAFIEWEDDDHGMSPSFAMNRALIDYCDATGASYTHMAVRVYESTGLTTPYLLRNLTP